LVTRLVNQIETGNNMKKKIFKNLLIISTFSILLAFTICMYVFYRNFEKQIILSNKTEAYFIKEAVENNGIEYLKKLEVPDGGRITYIKSDGKVLYDTEVDYKTMENHIDRNEVIEALKDGYGLDKRVSDTLKEGTYYYAIKLTNGYVLRVATTVDSIYTTFFNILPLISIVLVCLLIFAGMISKIITKNIVRPINEIDLDNPDTMFIYDEIYPLIKKLESQNKIISEQMIDLRDKRIEFEAITENMNEGFIILDTNSHVLSYNTAAIKFLDVAEVEERISNIIVFNRSKRFQRVAKEALSGNRSECVLELHNNMYHIIANPVMDDEIVKGAVLLIMDATEKEQRERLRREFSANVSHELKTPLTSISGYAEIIKSKMVKPEDIEKFAGIIHTEAVRLIELVKDIIKISKLDESNELFEEKEVDIYNLCQDIRKRLEKQAEDKNIEISITGESVIIKTVDHIVDEIIYNLIDNAIKYNKNNGQITVSVKETKTRVNVTVSDTGIGIPKADLNRIFERFYRVDKSHSKDVGGTGLGLSIVKHGANYLGADIKVESEEEKGTIISVSFKK